VLQAATNMETSRASRIVRFIGRSPYLLFRYFSLAKAIAMLLDVRGKGKNYAVFLNLDRTEQGGI
jgi:hypothetical protein